MNNEARWIERKIRLGWVALTVGALLAVAGILLRWLVSDLPFNERIVTGVGILFLALGIARLAKYRAARGDREVIRRLTAEERDERTIMIRGRAGYRAYWASAALAYALLMWLSFADNGSLPQLSGNALWYAMAGVVLGPMVVYIGSITADSAHL